MKYKFYLKRFFFPLSLLIIIITFHSTVNSQTPGNVSPNLKLWLKADAGVTTASGGKVASWNNQVANSAITAQASKPATSNVTLQNNKSNYNPAVVFDGSAYQELRGLANSSNWNGQLTIYAVANYTGTTPISVDRQAGIFETYNKGILSYQDYYFADGNGAYQPNSANTIPGTIKSNQLIGTEYLSNSTYGTSMYQNGKLADTHLGSSVSALPSDTFEIGGRLFSGSMNRIFSGNLSEVIVYNGVHSQTEREQIQSYLAIKNGLTLDRSGTAIYRNSIGGIIFNDSSSFWHDIIGIGRDENTALLQKQSHQHDDLTRLYLTNLASSNEMNTDSFSSDNQYIIIGHNDASINETSSLEFPLEQSIYKRIGREWKIVNTNFNGTFTLDIATDIGQTKVSDLRVLIDDDGNFENAVVGTANFSYANGLLTVSGISNAQIPVNSYRYITIAASDVNRNLKLWLRADSGVTTVSGRKVTSWNNQIVNSAITAQASKSATANVVLQNNKSNYNPAVVYDGTAYQELRGLAETSNWSGQLTIYAVANYTGTTPISANRQAGVFETYNKGILSYDDYYFVDGKGAFQPNSANTVPGTIKGNQLIGAEYTADDTYGSSMYQNGKLAETFLGSSVSSLPSDTFEIGGRLFSGLENRIFVGNLSEIMVYKAIHSRTEREKIQSYLAIKNGLTLDRSGTANYRNSNGSIIFTDSSAYWHDVIGIGKDDYTSLLQKQSHQQDDSTRLYISNLAATNQLNTDSFSSNSQFIMIGHNEASLNQTSSSEFPVNQGIYKRIGREWKITNTNFYGAFSLDITTDIGNLNLSDLRILTDDDGDFNDATLFNASFSFTNGILTVAGISNNLVSQNSTKYITIAASNSTPLAIKNLSFSAVSSKDKTTLLWSLVNAGNERSYIIQRAANGREFTDLGSIQAKPSSSSVNNYFYDDTNPLSGINYYRLKIVEQDGSYTLSKIITVNVQADLSNVIIYPNPAHNSLFIQIRSSARLNKTIQVVDVNGRILQRLVVATLAGINSFTIDISALPAGNYMLTVKGEEESMKKFIKD